MWGVLALGGVAAGSVYVGMYVARSPRVSAKLRLGLTSATIGILLFLFVQLLSVGNQEVSAAVPSGLTGVWFPASLLAAGFVAGFGLLPLVTPILIRWSLGTNSGALRRLDPPAGAAGVALAPFQLSLITAAGIGMHNFAEGLAIGSTYAAGVVTLTVLLAVGIIAHKSAEGFCICGCASTPAQGLSAIQLGLLGLVGGGPTLLGILVGGLAGSGTYVSVFVYGLAAGALISVVLLVYDTQLRFVPRTVLTAGLALGFLLAFVTDIGLSLAGF